MTEADVWSPVVVSGAGRGLGLEVARSLLADGHRVAGFSRGRTEPVAELLAGYPERFHFETLDINDSAGLESFVRTVQRTFGPVAGLVNNAAHAYDGPFVFDDPGDLARALEVNVTGLINLTRLCVGGMLRRRRGSIVSISSVSAVRGIKGVAGYSATKAAVDGLTRSLARELGPQGIRVNSAVLGYFATQSAVGMLRPDQVDTIAERTPLKRVGDIAEMVAAVRFLLSPAAGFITGQSLVVDGGFSC
jgi:3-oxoacyl-[acyl-carrier protein] reductase